MHGSLGPGPNKPPAQNKPDFQPRSGAEEAKTTELNSDWRDFRAQADATYATELAEEMRLRKEVLPVKKLPFRSPVTHPEIIFEQNVEVRMRDGVCLRVDIWRPKAAGKFPVILQRGPYDKRATLDWAPAVMRHFAERGYIAIKGDVRGRYASEGDFTPFIHEIEDGHDTVEWAAALDFSNGKVGMIGISYEGFASYSAAISQAPHLRCIYPGMIGYGAIFRDERGILLFDASTWSLWAGNPTKELLNVHRIDHAHLPLVEIGDKAGFPNALFNAAICMDYGVPLQGDIERDLAQARLSRIKIPTYSVCGWYDELITEALSTWEKLAQSQPGAKLLIGPYHHNVCDMEQARIGKVPTKDVESKRYFEEAEKFFAFHLKGEKNELGEREDAIRLFVMGANEWRNEKEWPIRRTVYRDMYLHSSGAAASQGDDGALEAKAPSGEQPADAYNYDPLDPVRGLCGYEIWTFLDEMGDRARHQARPDVLVYTSAPLREAIEVTGVVRVEIFCATDAPDTDFIANLVDVYPDGHTQYLTHGMVRARYRNGALKPELLEPGRIYKYAFEMRPTANLFRKGHRIQIEITSSDFSRYTRNQNVADAPGMTANVKVARQKIYHSKDYPSRICLPEVPPLKKDTIRMVGKPGA